MKTEERIAKQKELERQRALEAYKRAQARIPETSGKWAARKAKWDGRERKFLK